MNDIAEPVALDVICAGLGRTGTSSLKLALETLGFGPCYHMRVVFEDPSQTSLWRKVMDGAPDWPAILAGYRAIADEPAALYWEALARLCPDAKIILNTRPAKDWYDSVLTTIHTAVENRDAAPNRDAKALLEMVNELLFEGLFGGDFRDREKVLRIFEARNQAIVDAADAERLLVYSVSEGWEPLCSFLSVPVPDTPFPHVNTRTEFRKEFRPDANEGAQS